MDERESPDNIPVRSVDLNKIEEIVKEHFYPGPISGSTNRLAKALKEYLDGL